ncbi:hypothetical protein FRC08_007726 [Ceratobasidium sp. 394]|nr:hypothetical protein FRC08_007726 [Ceratobasidium sp. 394]
MLCLVVSLVARILTHPGGSVGTGRITSSVSSRLVSSRPGEIGYDVNFQVACLVTEILIETLPDGYGPISLCPSLSRDLRHETLPSFHEKIFLTSRLLSRPIPTLPGGYPKDVIDALGLLRSRLELSTTQAFPQPPEPVPADLCLTLSAPSIKKQYQPIPNLRRN